MAETQVPATKHLEPAPASAALRAGRALLTALLLLGPLVATEMFVRGQIRWLRPEFRAYPVAMDAKIGFIGEREHCPDAVIFGTSLLDRGLPPAVLQGRDVGGHIIESAFDFANADVRATNMLAAYLWLDDFGCEPPLVFIEASPIALTSVRGGKTHDSAFMGLRTQFAMPDGFAGARDYDTAHLASLATTDRLLLHRRRQEIVDRFRNHFEIDSWFLSRDEAARTPFVPSATGAGRDAEPLQLDGKLTRYAPSLAGARLEREQRKRRGQLARGELPYKLGAVEAAALLDLIDRAAARGARVIVTTPPATTLYWEEIAPQTDAMAPWDAFSSQLSAHIATIDGATWIDWLRSREFENEEFSDWLHLTESGAQHYTRALTEAARADWTSREGKP